MEFLKENWADIQAFLESVLNLFKALFAKLAGGAEDETEPE